MPSKGTKTKLCPLPRLLGDANPNSSEIIGKEGNVGNWTARINEYETYFAEEEYKTDTTTPSFTNMARKYLEFYLPEKQPSDPMLLIRHPTPPLQVYASIKNVAQTII